MSWTPAEAPWGNVRSVDEDKVRRLAEELESLRAEHGALSREWIEGQERLLGAVNDRAEAHGEMFVRPVKLKHRFSPNDPAILLVDRPGVSLYLEPWIDDPGQGPIRFTFDSCDAATFSPPNDENLRLSPLDALGFGWWPCITVGNSPWVRLFPWHAVDHYVFLLKDHCFHALAKGFVESRVDKADFATVQNALADVPWQLLGGKQPPTRSFGSRRVGGGASIG